jgi:Tol biopolymer transport system component
MRTVSILAGTVAALLVPLAAPARAVTTASTLIAFVADPDDDGVYALYTRPANGSGSPAVLFTTTDDVFDAALSPDGTKVAYTAVNQTDFQGHVYVRPVSGGAATQLTDGLDDVSAAWSRDGSTIAFTRHDANGDRTIWTVPSDGTPAAAVEVPGTAGGGQPEFSPSGRQMLMTHFDANDVPGGIDVVTLATHARSRVDGTAGGYLADWSPNGQTIAFTKRLTCGSAILSVPASGGIPTVLRSAAGRWADSPEYSNDGTQLFWSETPDDCTGSPQPGDHWAAAADGTGPALVGATPTIDESGLSLAGGTLAADTTAPAAPVLGTFGGISATTANITWTAGPDATEFVVLRKAHGAPAPTSISDGTLVYDGAEHAATATGLVEGTAYDLYVYALDGSGRVSPVSAAHPARPAAPPVVNPVGLVSSIATGVKFPVSWNGGTAKFQVLYGERERVAANTWDPPAVTRVWYMSTPLKTSTFTGAQGHTYYFKVTGIDEFGNITAESGIRSANLPFNDTYYGLAYSAGWTTPSSSTRWMGTLRSHTAAGASMTFTVEAASFTVVGDRCAACGQVRVYVDGVLRATVDTRAANTLVRQVLYAGPALAGDIRSHTIRLVVVGTAGRPKVNLDGIVATR